jgi:hypothetical protein
LIDKKCEWAGLDVGSEGRPCKEHQLQQLAVNKKKCASEGDREKRVLKEQHQ